MSNKLLIILAALCPVAASAQTQQPTNCRTLESSGNFVGSDEVIFNGMACKLATPVKSETLTASRTTTATLPHSQPSTAESSDITNDRVIEMTKLGLDDDIIIAKIKEWKMQIPTDRLGLGKSEEIWCGLEGDCLDARRRGSYRTTSHRK
jgi:hypothetical protein